MTQGAIRVAIVAGEESGDALAGNLMAALSARLGPIEWFGIGGDRMAEEGLNTLFPQEEISVMGLDAIIRQLPRLLGRIREAADAVIAFAPDILIIVDAPEFTHRVAKRVRKARPDIPIVNYVSPTVWAWRPGRAAAMRPYVDHVLALFPFEPAEHARLGGPPCTYVGHPLFEAMRSPAPPSGDTLLVLPGSRRGEITRLMPVFGRTLAALNWSGPVRLLTLPRLEEAVRTLAQDWPLEPQIVTGADAKAAAFAETRAALAASGTVTFELAAARIPMLVAYKLDFFYRQVKRLHPVFPIVTARSMVLANIIIGRNAVPEFLEEKAEAEHLAPALDAILLPDGAGRAEQLAAFEDVARAMTIDTSPAEQAADVVCKVLDRGF